MKGILLKILKIIAGKKKKSQTCYEVKVLDMKRMNMFSY